MKFSSIFLFLLLCTLIIACDMKDQSSDPVKIRFATYNCSLNRNELGILQEDLSKDDNLQGLNIAEVIQRVRPDVLLLQEFDYDPSGKSLQSFMKEYLGKSQKGLDPVDFPYYYIPATNTGFPSGVDFDKNGKLGGGGDAFGFGAFPGQYGFVLLSKYPIDSQNIRTLQDFLWKDMPNAHLPINADSSNYYSDEAMSIFRLSSKNHIDIPLLINKEVIHVLAAHPTPPVFDGAEDRNGKRNYDEIRLLADYISNEGYITDDKGKSGGLGNASFVIMGDMNADPADGDSYANAITQLLDHSRVNVEVAKGKHIPQSQGGFERSENRSDTTSTGNPAQDTSHWGLRVDYVLPSADIKVDSSGIFWPTSDDELSYLMERNATSDHLPVWVDVWVQL